MANKHKGAEHHTQAAEHLDHAARHHREAAKHDEAGSYEKGAHHAHIAHGHTLHARHHANEAGKHYADEHGGSNGVHTEDDQLPVGKKAQGRNLDSNAQKNALPDKGALAPQTKGKHSTGHLGQKPKPRHE
jgi:hypothetical protein